MTYKTLILLYVLTVSLTCGAEHFHPVDVKDGLADNFVRDITTDSEGYVWLSTINGLSRYDGYRFLNFQPQRWGGQSSDVAMVRETRDGTLWMRCTGEKLRIGDRTRGMLLTYRRDMQTWVNDGEERLAAMGVSGKLQQFYVDDERGLWVATDRGLWHQDFNDKASMSAMRTETGAIKIRHIVSRNGTTLVVSADYDIYKVTANGRLALLTRHPKPEAEDRDSRAMLDSRMNLWLYHAHNAVGELRVWSMGSGEWIQPAALLRLDGNVTVNALAEDREGRLWVGTGNQGIYVLQWNTAKTTLIPMGSHITCLFADPNNTMWAGTAKLGAAYADLNSPDFVHITTEGREDVSVLMEDAQGKLWIGFDGAGVMTAGKTFTARDGQLPSDHVTAMTIDRDGHTLVGTYGGGVARLAGNRFEPLYADQERLRYVKALATDRHGSLWVATVDKGVVRITDGTFTFFTVDSPSSARVPGKQSPLQSDGTTSLAYDAALDRMYIGTSIGLAAYDCANGSFIDDTTIDSLRNVNVTALLADNYGRLWIGTRDGLWVKNRTLQHLTTDQGLSHNVVRALAISGTTVWASTDNGLTCMTPEGDILKCRPFFDSDGLTGIIFSNNAALTTHEGTVLLGSQTGYVSIPAGSLTPNTPLGHRTLATEGTQEHLTPNTQLTVRFTEFRINGQPVVMSPKGFTIDYGERLGVSLSMMVPALSSKARYLYRFKGEREWMRAPNNTLYFASLMPGTHTLQVKCELTGIATTDVSELSFRVRAPLLLNNWAILCYLLLLATAVWLLWRAIRRRQKREVAMKRMEINLKKYEMEEQKISFFTNISHDIKTPLTMVMAPLEKIRDASLPPAVRTEIDVAWQNARQLYDLVLELLDFRRLDEGKEMLNLSHGELVSFVRRLAQSFDYIAHRRNISLELHMPETPVEMAFDKNKVRRVVINLLSNAFKYNVDGGSVIVTLSPPSTPAGDATFAQQPLVAISVADTGIGVKDKHHIFDRFVQETHGQEQEGSGLGLHIVRQYVDMMGGTISVADNHPAGTVFTVALPVENAQPPTFTPQHLTPNSQHPTPNTQPSNLKPAILIVEDNTDARLFLQRSLEDEYHLLTASNGSVALTLLAKQSVDLIVSDVMMPVMDGIELVRKVRQNIRYSHIPVILLTAKSGEEDIIAGLQEGVADYLTKPYSLAVLRLRIRKILEWTHHVHEQVATGIDIKPSEITVSSLDEELIGHVIAEVEEHMADPTYSVVQLSAAIGMTRGTLYKKLMAIVGKSPVEFIRIVRIRRGKDLLDQGRTNVSEVADKVGFSPKMFAQYFREMYGNSPSEYLRQLKEKKK